MALHIDEIAIQLSVGGPEQGRRRRSSSRRRADDDDDDDDDDDELSSAGGDSDCCDHQAIVADAVQQVLRILRDREAR